MPRSYKSVDNKELLRMAAEKLEDKPGQLKRRKGERMFEYSKRIIKTTISSNYEPPFMKDRGRPSEGSTPPGHGGRPLVDFRKLFDPS